jgi:hypothetical protein
MDNKNEKARRYNKGKLNYSLLPEKSLKEIAKIYSMGAEKYTVKDESGDIISTGADNWKKGLSIKSLLDSAQRHIEKFKAGIDYDYDWPDHILETYGPSEHLGNAIWNLLTIMETKNLHPMLDDREQWFKKPIKKVFCDLDGVFVDFEKHFLTELNLESSPPTDWDDYRFRDNFNLIANNDKFWLTAPRIIEPSDITYPIAGYVTSRPCDNQVTTQWLRNNGFPSKKLINVGLNNTKVEALLAENCEVFVDDSFNNFVDCQSNGILCYLMSRPHNMKYDVGHYRVNNFKEFLNKVKGLETVTK